MRKTLSPKRRTLTLFDRSHLEPQLLEHRSIMPRRAKTCQPPSSDGHMTCSLQPSYLDRWPPIGSITPFRIPPFTHGWTHRWPRTIRRKSDVRVVTQPEQFSQCLGIANAP